MRIDGFGCYDVIEQPDGVTWYDANDYCVGTERTLLAIESVEENDAFENYLQQNEGK